MKNNKNTSRLPKIALAAAALLVFLASPTTRGGTAFWTGVNGANWSGDGGGENWSSTAASPGVPYQPVNGDSLRWLSFSNLNKVSTNDLVGLSVANISFQGAPSGIVLNGNKLTVTGTIGNSGSSGTINLPIELNAATVVIGNHANDTIVFNGDITETGGARAVRSQGGNITLSGNNSFSGNVQVGFTTADATFNINTLKNIGQSQSLGSGSLVTLGFRNTKGTVVYTGGATTTDKGFAIGENQVSQTGNTVGSFINNGSGAVVWTGTQTLLDQNSTTARTLELGGSNADNNDWQSVINNNNGGTLGVTKTGVGKWILGGTNLYTGATTVSEGTLLVNGSTAAGSAVSVAANAIIGGDGTINGNLTLANGALFAFDPLATLDLGGTLTLDFSFGVASLRNSSGGAINWGSIADGTYTLMNTSFTFNDTNISNFGLANAADIGGGRSAYFDNGSLELVVIPEPGTLALVGMAGLALVAGLRRRK